jgi:acyl carrier protein
MLHNETSTQERIRTAIEKATQKMAPVNPEASLFESGVLDSFALLDVISEIETEFQIQVTDADLDPRKFASVARIDRFVHSQIGHLTV